jgi:hypothetical protein
MAMTAVRIVRFLPALRFDAESGVHTTRLSGRKDRLSRPKRQRLPRLDSSRDRQKSPQQSRRNQQQGHADRVRLILLDEEDQ